MNKKVSPSKLFYFIVEETGEKCDEKSGYKWNTSVVKVYKDEGNVLIAEIEQRCALRWFMQKGVQYLVCPYGARAEKGTVILNCETGRMIETPIKQGGRGFYGIDISPDSSFIAVHTYNGYQNMLFIYKTSNVEYEAVSEAKIKPFQMLPVHGIDFDGEKETFESHIPDVYENDFGWMEYPEMCSFQWIGDGTFKITTSEHYYHHNGKILTTPTMRNPLPADEKFKYDDDWFVAEYASSIYEWTPKTKDGKEEKEESGEFVQKSAKIYEYKDRNEADFYQLYEKQPNPLGDDVQFWAAKETN